VFEFSLSVFLFPFLFPFSFSRPHLAVRRPLHLGDGTLHVTFVAAALGLDLSARGAQLEVDSAGPRSDVATSALPRGRRGRRSARHRGAQKGQREEEAQGGDRSARFRGGEHGVGGVFCFFVCAWSFFTSGKKRVKRGEIHFWFLFRGCFLIFLQTSASSSSSSSAAAAAEEDEDEESILLVLQALQ